MKLLKYLFVLLLLAGIINAPTYAAVNDVELISCGIFNDENGSGDDKKEGGEEEEEEEPDCE